jgi:hypothetical protein
MTELEHDVARVRAVHDALGAPLVVWVCKWEFEHDFGFMLFTSQAGARDQLLEWFDELDEEDLKITVREYNALRKKILTNKVSGFDNDSNRWYSYETKRVLP